MGREITFVAEPPRVFVVGHTAPDWDAFDAYLAYRGAAWNTPLPDRQWTTAIAEAAGRVCYQSWHNPKRSSHEEYLQTSIVEHKHGSVLEHVWLNFLVADLPRSVQLELVRHGEGTAFSFESQRFTDTNLRFVIPPLIRHDPLLVMHFKDVCEGVASSYHAQLELIAAQELTDGLGGTMRRKRAKEAARALLPNACGSDGMVSINARALRHIIELRSSEHADASMREFAAALYTAARPRLEAILADATAVMTGTPEALEVAFRTSKV